MTSFFKHLRLGVTKHFCFSELNTQRCERDIFNVMVRLLVQLGIPRPIPLDGEILAFELGL